MDITGDEIQGVVTDAVNEMIAKEHSMFREQLESFINQYLKKTNKYYKLPKNCSKHMGLVAIYLFL